MNLRPALASLALLAVLPLAACSSSNGEDAAADTSTSGASADASAGSSSSASADGGEQQGSKDCIPQDVVAASIPLADGTPVCDLARGTLADGDLSLVIEVDSVSAGFDAATQALESAGYEAGVKSPDGANYSNGTYMVLLTVAEQDPYGAVATYAISAA